MALIKCKNCGHMISDKAVKCPKCGCSIEKEMLFEGNVHEISETDTKSPYSHSPFSITRIMKGNYGYLFFFFSVLLFIDSLCGIVFFFSIRMENIEIFDTLISYSSILIPTYWIGIIGINYILGRARESKSLQLSAFALCAIAFAVRELLFVGKVESSPIYILPYLFVIIAFLIILQKDQSVLGLAIIILLLSLICNVLYVIISDFSLKFIVDVISSLLQTISSICFLYVATKHIVSQKCRKSRI